MSDNELIEKERYHSDYPYLSLIAYAIGSAISRIPRRISESDLADLAAALSNNSGLSKEKELEAITNIIVLYDRSQGGPAALMTLATLYPEVERIRAREAAAGIVYKNEDMYKAGLKISDLIVRYLYPLYLSHLANSTKVHGKHSESLRDEALFMVRELSSYPPMDDAAEAYAMVYDLLKDSKAGASPAINIELRRLCLYLASNNKYGSQILYIAQRLITAIFIYFLDAHAINEIGVASKFLNNAVLSITKGGTFDESPALHKFVQETGFMSAIPRTRDQKKEARVEARLALCVKELSDELGLDLTKFSSPGAAAAHALRKADQIDQASNIIGWAIEDCISILESDGSE